MAFETQERKKERKMRLEMVIQNEILNGESIDLFSKEPYEKKPAMTIKDFVLYSNPTTQIPMDLNFIDPQTRVPHYC